MQHKEKVALFDFCETIANFQTADAYVKYVRDHYGNKRTRCIEKLRTLLSRTYILFALSIVFAKGSINKRMVLLQLKGYSINVLEKYAKEYYECEIRPNLIHMVVNELIKLRDDGWKIVLVSAGYEIYLKYFANEYNIQMENVISVRIKFKNGICYGTFDGGDRLWDKTEQLDKKFDRSEIQSIAYSDSPSDLPLLLWAKDGVVVRRRDRNGEWYKNFNFREIIWEK